MNKYKNVDDYSYDFKFNFFTLSIIFTIVDILKEIHEVIMLKQEYINDLYNYPTVFGSILKLIFLYNDYSLFINGYSHN